MASNKYFQDIDIQFIEESNTHTKVVAEPFDRGYGVTIGNSLRRTLLTSLPGAAITSIKIDGVAHEFTTIDGVLEDVADIILNLKDVRFRMVDEGPELILVELHGPCKFTGVDISNVAKMFEVLNPDHHIATITEEKTLVFEIRISRGKGYSPAIKNKRKDDTIGTIPIDAIFNPVTKVSWDVQPIATSTEGHERLTMEIYSDGSTTPKDAINHAASITRQQLAYFMFNDSSAIKAVNEEEINEALEIKGILTKSIDEMELSVRSHNCLQAAGIRTISELVSKEESEMLKFKNFGRKSLTELQEKLGELELHFGMDVNQYLEQE
ncbi:MAG: DNA-directed RNA polymerase subunit alpha [Candidatus Marinimicrobia bacterium]|jgi:DNA-directed RNA polymerase subunit alpha|nr:DNA-directed RNA polymerase subunit alpha [Candidatus Neomarinimicrobiota bacterium]MDP6936324.1 DNA-directed RNA polymerase subunit alpha [Candidatus Neomarinimicrobiota bacterium]